MSLVETCTGVAIVSAIVFFAAPSLIRVRDNYQLDQTTRQLAGQMQWTRIKAISRDRDCRLRVISTTSYVIECKESTCAVDETVTLPAGFKITARRTPQFHKRGNASPAATITIWDRHFNSKSVVVNITGRVRVE
jgi:Tfp pilus assembly protein FimT